VGEAERERAALMGGALAFRFTHNMDQTPRIVPGERNFAMPANVVPRGASASCRRSSARPRQSSRTR
jgi:hypothetical protein